MLSVRGIFDGSISKYLYELRDHQGNVRAVIGNDYTNSATSDYACDYYPGGWEMPDRQLIGSKEYRYGYQGRFAEREEETNYDQFEARLYDSRICRWMVPDPAKQYWSPYLAMGNNWVNLFDPNGKTAVGDYLAAPNQNVIMLNEVTIYGVFTKPKWYYLKTGFNFVSDVGQGFEQRMDKLGTAITTNITKLIAALKGFAGLGSGREQENLAEPLRVIKEGTEIGYEAAAAVKEVVKEVKESPILNPANDLTIKEAENVKPYNFEGDSSSQSSDTSTIRYEDGKPADTMYFKTINGKTTIIDK